MQAVNAAEEFEQKHYQTNSAGEAEELDAGDFTRAAKQAGNLICSAAQSATTTVKEVVVGKVHLLFHANVNVHQHQICCPAALL